MSPREEGTRRDGLAGVGLRNVKPNVSFVSPSQRNTACRHAANGQILCEREILHGAVLDSFVLARDRERGRLRSPNS